MPDLSIIILNWNTRDLLEQCLASIFDNEPSCSFEVIVVDNDSAETIDGLEEKFGAVKLMRNDYNYGFSAGNNIGYRASSGRYVMPLNPDTLIFPGTIDRLLNELEANESVAIALPVLHGTKVIRKNYTFFSLFFVSMIYRNLRKFTEKWRSSVTEPFDVELFVGTGYICRRSALEADRMFREDYFLFGEEFALCREMAGRGFSIRVVPEAVITHHTSVTFKTDTLRLMTATRLAIAVTWEIHREWLGRTFGTLTALFLCVEHVPKLIYLNGRKFFQNGGDPRLQRAAAQSGAIVASMIPLLTNDSRFRKRANKEAEEFFNNGKRLERSTPSV